MKYELRYDLRNPPQWRQPWDVFYQRFLDQVVWAEANGFSAVQLSEHHFSDDGYLPSLVAMAGALIGRTSTITIRLGLVLLPLKHPVQLAEDIAMLDILSGGRVELVVGAGYRRAEFEGYGVPMNQRPSLMEEGIEILRRCWTEDSFDFEGKRWTLENVRVMPKPLHPIKIVMGGSSTAAAQRAARIADGFAPSSPQQYVDWREEMERLGKDPGPAPDPSAPRPPPNLLHVAHDPDEAWKVVGPHALYESQSYAGWSAERGNSNYVALDDPDELRKLGSYAVMTPEQVVEMGRAMEAANPPGTRLVFHPMVGGLPHEVGQSSLDLVVAEVMPNLE
jgi:alkanesulfonate monooxygenase SsuD/methylene tetrahydromethanopterin reductase-like flavin-dependent oxidoreductase (luciferase family)